MDQRTPLQHVTASKNECILNLASAAAWRKDAARAGGRVLSSGLAAATLKGCGVVGKTIVLAITCSMFASLSLAQTPADLTGSVRVLSRDATTLRLVVEPNAHSGPYKQATKVTVYKEPLIEGGNPTYRMDAAMEFDCGLLVHRLVKVTRRAEAGAVTSIIMTPQEQWKSANPQMSDYRAMQSVCNIVFISTERGTVDAVIQAWRDR